MLRPFFIRNIILIVCLSFILPYTFAGIPLPEHPRPDFWRSDWENLNGTWAFQFDSLDEGETGGWYEKSNALTEHILVPFSWGAPLSGVEDKADIGWYSRNIIVPESWKGKRIFVVVGASDWKTRGWLDGQFLGENQGGYTPFEFEITPHVIFDQEQKITFRVDDTDHPFKLEGKQGYGKARGIWQTVYLEARGNIFLNYVHITPDIDHNLVNFQAELSNLPDRGSKVRISIKGENGTTQEEIFSLDPTSSSFNGSISLKDPRLWTLEDPHLYDVKVSIETEENVIELVNMYFGMRKIDAGIVPGTDYSYVRLNNHPVYLQLTLDQAYHPEGYYTFPSDAFMRDEILRSRKIGLNGQRIHVKIGIPRKLYWADKLGMLIMADVPNSWGGPDAEMRSEIEKALREMIRRDYNHPSIFSWVIFNETWGLLTEEQDGKRTYIPETKEWVGEMYQTAKILDPTRLVEDNSANRRDHVATDLNTWHAYLPGYAWKEFLQDAVDNTYPGSGWNFSEGFVQGHQPMLNSECGNVWGYQGSTGDVDWSWDYHIMINDFRLQPKIAGWLYTEHHDVINEWNGYYKYDRSEKFTGLESFNGMTINDLHSQIQITPDLELMTDLQAGSMVSVPLWLSVFTEQLPYREAVIKYNTQWISSAGIKTSYTGTTSASGDPGPQINQVIDIKPWQSGYLDPIHITAPGEEGVLILNVILESMSGNSIHKNFVMFRIRTTKDHVATTYSPDGKILRLVSFKPDQYKASAWSIKKWDVLDGKKVNGSGSGYFEYEVIIPGDLAAEDIEEAVFRVELSSKQLYGKDRPDSDAMEGDYMRGRGTHDPSRNPNAYPMTDEEKFPSYVRIKLNGVVINECLLPDDPADHRGMLSWHAQPRDNKLREAGSYGYLITSPIPEEMVQSMVINGKCNLRIEVPEILPGGVAIYGKDFGRFPLDPTLVFQMKKK